MPKRMSHDEFVKKLQQERPNLELLSEYNGNKEKITVRCTIHDYTFITTPNRLRVSNCIKCYQDTIGDRCRKTAEQFIEEAKQIHGNRYDYSKVKYTGNKDKVCIICPEHGEFWQTPNKHLMGQGCNKCACAKNGFNKRLSQEEFIKRSKEVHFGKYDYSKTVYTGYDSDIIIICPEHGEFEQNAYVHLSGHGCPKCNSSHLEKTIKNILIDEVVSEYYKFKELGRQNLDIYLPKYKVAIECQGGQHVFPVGYFGGQKEFERIQERDIRKNKVCKESGIKLLYVFPQKHKNNLIKYKETNPGSIYTDENTFILEDIQSDKEKFFKCIKNKIRML